MTTKIAVITENFRVPWNPNDIEDFLGGSQEVVVLFSEALKQNGYDVSVFTHGETKTVSVSRNSVSYSDFSIFNYDFDVIILFKINPLNTSRINSKLGNKPKIIFWSSDVQKHIPGSTIDNIQTVCLTNYHKTRNENKNALVFPHGIDFNSLNRNKTQKIPNTVLYSSSLNRGVENLLNAWSIIKKHFPNLKLKITYGFKIENQFVSNLGKELIKKNEKYINDVTNFLGIEYLSSVSKNEIEKLYWESEYWILPLNNADSELFCLNAIKAQYCGCIPIVNKIGALQETVSNYIPFEEFIKGNKSIKIESNVIPSYSWDEVIEKWKHLFD